MTYSYLENEGFSRLKLISLSHDVLLSYYWIIKDLQRLNVLLHLSYYNVVLLPTTDLSLFIISDATADMINSFQPYVNPLLSYYRN